MNWIPFDDDHKPDRGKHYVVLVVWAGEDQSELTLHYAWYGRRKPLNWVDDGLDWFLLDSNNANEWGNEFVVKFYAEKPTVPDGYKLEKVEWEDFTG